MKNSVAWGLIGLTMFAAAATGSRAQGTSPLGNAAAASQGGAQNQIRIGGPQPAASGSSLLATITPDITLRIMKDAGFTKLAPTTNNGQAHVLATIGQTDTFIWHENCENKNCVTLFFSAYFGKQDSVSAQYINDYNTNTMYTKMFKNGDDELVLTMAVSLYKGVSEEHVLEMGKMWIQVFKEALDYKPKR